MARPDVIVLGADPAGLSAARDLVAGGAARTGRGAAAAALAHGRTVGGAFGAPSPVAAGYGS